MKKNLRIVSLGLALSLVFSSFGFAQDNATARSKYPNVKKDGKSELSAVMVTTNNTSNLPKDDIWLRWDDATTRTSVGAGASTYDVAIRFEPSDIADYDDFQITSVTTYVNSVVTSSVIKIWQGADGDNLTELVSQSFDPTGTSWNTIVLDNPCTIDASLELWVGIRYEGLASTWPAGIDQVSDHSGKGNMVRFPFDADNDTIWYAITDLASTLVGDWNIAALVVEGGGSDTYAVTFNVDMNDVDGFDYSTDIVYLTGSMVGWAQPGTTGSIEMDLVSKSTREVILEEGFEGDVPPTGWLNVDADGDTQVWFSYTAEGSPHSGSKSAASASWTSATGALTPDNWLITPQIVVANDTYMLEYYVGAQDPDWPEEKYAVLISTSGTDAADFTEVFSETMTDGAWYQREVSLADFAGESIYIAFRHYDVSDMFYFKLDDVLVTGEGGTTPDDLTYTATLELEAAEYQYKYFLNAGWDGGEWTGDPNRLIIVEGNMVQNDIWAYYGPSDEAFILTFGFDELTDEEVVIEGFDINVTVAAGTDITSLTPTMTISENAMIDYAYPTAMDFTTVQHIVVTAEDGETTNTYNVNVTITGAEVNTISNITVYPNPFSNFITINNAENVTRVIVTNLIGQVVMDMPLNGSERISTSNLNNGVYLVTFQAKNGERVVRKMIKQ